MSPKDVQNGCPICKEGVLEIDYKQVDFLRKYITKFNKIVPRYYSGNCLKHQKALALAIKKARYMGMLPYVLEVKSSPKNIPVQA
jgi:small subunit ribosomal protein S18